MLVFEYYKIIFEFNLIVEFFNICIIQIERLFFLLYQTSIDSKISSFICSFEICIARPKRRHQKVADANP